MSFFCQPQSAGFAFPLLSLFSLGGWYLIQEVHSYIQVNQEWFLFSLFCCLIMVSEIPFPCRIPSQLIEQNWFNSRTTEIEVKLVPIPLGFCLTSYLIEWNRTCHQRELSRTCVDCVVFVESFSVVVKVKEDKNYSSIWRD